MFINLESRILYDYSILIVEGIEYEPGPGTFIKLLAEKSGSFALRLNFLL